MAWQASTLHEFMTTAGRQQPCSAVSPGWAKCGNPPEGSRLFEALAASQQPQMHLDHVLLHGAAGIADADVSSLAAAASRWENLVQNAPNMLPHKVLASDLLGKAEVALVETLRPLMIQQQFAPCDHISRVIELYRYEQMLPQRRAALLECLNGLCTTVDITLDQLFQFETLAQWSRERNSCFHPLGYNALQLDAAAIAEARVTVTTSPEFQAVRESSLLLVRILEGWLPVLP